MFPRDLQACVSAQLRTAADTGAYLQRCAYLHMYMHIFNA